MNRIDKKIRKIGALTHLSGPNAHSYALVMIMTETKHADVINNGYNHNIFYRRILLAFMVCIFISEFNAFFVSKSQKSYFSFTSIFMFVSINSLSTQLIIINPARFWLIQTIIPFLIFHGDFGIKQS